MKKASKKNNTHNELVAIVYHLIVAIAIFFLVYVLNSFTDAAFGNLTIINDKPTQTQNFASQDQITYEDLSSKSYKLVILHIKIWTSKGNLDVLKLNLESDILETINDAENLVREDIIENLKNVSNKSAVLTTHLQNMETTLSKGDFFIMILDQDISTRTTQMNICIEEKKISDQAYFNSISYYDQQGMIEALKKSTRYNACIAQTRLEINAKKALVEKLKLYHNLLKKKYDFLSLKQDTILKNVNVLDTDILQELDTINSTLSTYDF